MNICIYNIFIYIYIYLNIVSWDQIIIDRQRNGTWAWAWQISPGSDLCTAQSRQPVNASDSFSLSRARRAEKFWRTAPAAQSVVLLLGGFHPHEWIEISIRSSLWRFRSRDYEITKPCI